MHTSVTSELLVLLIRNVAAAPTTVAATATEAAVSGSADSILTVSLLRIFPSFADKDPILTLGMEFLPGP